MHAPRETEKQLNFFRSPDHVRGLKDVARVVLEAHALPARVWQVELRADTARGGGAASGFSRFGGFCKRCVINWLNMEPTVSAKQVSACRGMHLDPRNPRDGHQALPYLHVCTFPANSPPNRSIIISYISSEATFGTIRPQYLASNWLLLLRETATEPWEPEVAACAGRSQETRLHSRYSAIVALPPVFTK